MPQRGCDLQPNVAASATLGNEEKSSLNRNAVASSALYPLPGATALRLRGSNCFFPRVAAEPATLGY